MNRTVLQVPLSVDLRKEAEKQALAQGFSSLQEAVRLFLRKLGSKTIGFTFEETEQLSPRAIKRYNKMIDDIEKGKVKTQSFYDVDSLIKHLHE